MTRYMQDNIPGIDEAVARAAQKDIDVESGQMHLAREFIRYGKYARFSKDPKFAERFKAQQMTIALMMGKVRG